jgi:plasmid replication initiation protein
MKNNESLVWGDESVRDSSLSGKHVNLSNALVSAAQSLTLAEKRVMCAAVAKLDSLRRDGGFKDGLVKLSAHEYAEVFGLDPNTAYEQLKEASENLFQRYIRIVEDTRRGPKEIKFRWVSRAEYHKGEGTVAMRFTQDVGPHLVNLQRQFTSYKLSQASALRSLYSWRLLELLTQFESTGWRVMSVDDFAHAMEATEKQRANFNNIKRRIIEPAVRELVEKDGWQITWEPVKAGRKVTDLRFTFRRDPQGKLAL